MDYNKIGSFLEKFKKIIYQKEEVKNIVIEKVSTIIRHPIKKEALRIKNSCIYIEGSNILKSEILIHKKEILTSLKITLPKHNFSDIK